MKDKPISSQQLAFMIFLFLPGCALVYVTGKAAGQDAWIASILGAIPGLYIVFAILHIHAMYPDLRITQVSTEVLGKIPGTLLNILFFWSIFLFTLGFFVDIGMLMAVIYPTLIETFLYSMLVLTVVYCLYHGLNILARLGELFIWITLLFIIIGFLVALPLVKILNLTPVLEAWKPLAAGTLFAADWPFDYIIIFSLFLPLVSDLKENQKKIFKWYLISALILFISNFEAVAILGSRLIDLFQFPLYQSFRLAGFGEFRRVELGFLILWFITGITAITIAFQGLTFILQDIFSLKDYKALILPVGLCLVVFSLYMFPSSFEYATLSFQYMPIYTFPVNLLYPTIILLAAKLRKKQIE